jgi:hypothetical protein
MASQRNIERRLQRRIASDKRRVTIRALFAQNPRCSICGGRMTLATGRGRSALLVDGERLACAGCRAAAGKGPG